NGRPRLMCKARLDEFPERPITVRPMKAFPLIKDLVTDVSWNYRVAEKIPAFTPKEGEGPFVMYQQDVERSQEFRKCIECFLCQNVCHVLRDHEGQAAYSAPRPLARIPASDLHPTATRSPT